MCAVAISPGTFGGWRTAGFHDEPRLGVNSALFKSAHCTASVTAESDDVIRVRFAPAPEFAREEPYVRMPQAFSAPTTHLSTSGSETTLTTATLQITIHHTPFGITFADLHGRILDEDDTSLGTSFAGPRVQIAKRLDDATAIYGLGEKNGRLNKRGWCLGGYSYAMWATDAFAYDPSTDPLYVSVPFYMGVKDGRAFGIFFNNAHRTFFDIGRQQRGVLAFGAAGGELDYTFINGPHPRDVLARYAQLTGRTPLPPRWALGYHQSRWSYYPESRVRKLAADFRTKKVPGEVLWLDVHCLDGYAPFTWDRERFPNPKKLFADLRRDGFRVVPIVDPHIKAEFAHPPYDSGLAGNHFVKLADGTVYQAPVWPSNAEKNPRPSVFPDFTRPATREWWGTLLKEITDLGVAGIWNDMNEPAVFVPPSKTFPPDAMHDNEGAPTGHDAVHNLYGMLNSRATYESLRSLRPDTRPFVLTRASFAGGQRYAAVWTGDNSSDWSHLQQSLPMLLGLSLSGFTFVGADIGGFAGVATAELFTRWLQAGVFYPFMRAHTEINTPDQEPWVYGERHEAINRRAIELRYELLPHLYNVMAESCAAGLPAMRPLFFEFPADPNSADVDDVFLFGRDLLVAPVIKLEQTSRHTYLPPGDWYDFWTGHKLTGGQHHQLQVTLESLPIFVRAGGFIFLQPVVQHTGEMPGQPLIVCAYPGTAESSATYYEDDGETFAHERGGFFRRKFIQRREGPRILLDAEPADGDFQPAARHLVLRILAPGATPKSVTVNGLPLPRVLMDAGKSDTWRLADEGFIEVRTEDRRSVVRVVVER